MTNDDSCTGIDKHLSANMWSNIYVSVYLNLSISICLPVWLSIRLSVCLAACPCFCQSVCLSVRPSVHHSAYLSLSLSVRLCLPVCHSSSVNLTLRLSAYPLTSQYFALVQQSYSLIDRPAHALSLRKVRLRKKESKGESARERMGEWESMN